MKCFALLFFVAQLVLSVFSQTTCQNDCFDGVYLFDRTSSVNSFCGRSDPNQQLSCVPVPSSTLEIVLTEGVAVDPSTPGAIRLNYTKGNHLFLLKVDKSFRGIRNVVVLHRFLKSADGSRIILIQTDLSNLLVIDSTAGIISKQHLQMLAVADWIPTFDQSMPDFSEKKHIVINGFSTPNYIEHISDLSGRGQIEKEKIKTRYTLSPFNAIVASYLETWCAELGYEVTTQTFTVQSEVTRNVICKKVGMTFPHEIVVLGAHYDSISENPMNKAPGAIDDASGVAALMEYARLLAPYQFKHTIEIIFFGAEEQGLFGSFHYVENLNSPMPPTSSSSATSVGKRQPPEPSLIRAALVLDMIAYATSPEHYVLAVEGEKTGPDMVLMEAVMNNAKVWSPEIEVVMTSDDITSDHVPFQLAGWPAILAIQTQSYPHYHSSADKPNQCNFDFGTLVSKALLGAAWDLAVAFEPPRA